MKRNVLIFGLILGTILAVHMVFMVNLLYNNPDLESNDILGYAAMVVVFSLTFFGIRNYRNKQLNRVISLGKAFKTGALIALLGSTMYVVVWLFYYYLFVPDFLDKYILHVLNEATRNGATASELAAKTEEMDQFREMYKSPLFVILISYAEVLPIGLVVAFISSLILRRKPETITASER
ncbi:DUF4199 domain-containing protein [candidate division KSB1 bacterium]|nr:DUF4199 domain-containing protein [candidate division KSB1 bacterium]NIR72415.1 DUF4199 domain-containing protein [candidate division KSB1 bacterium]NIS26745.1 DUF4199 domain-containing protein [candidate division KSB1 bacterium]NIT73492.1 DUF4199 domain-containing protein [candidate division KSB1 bacterium]NIU27360.1 DUF4199 domain-containing protein [candidate division KSB1 bacterium]